MPDLLKEMRRDFGKIEGQDVAELVVLPSRWVMFDTGGRHMFAYYENQHKDLRGKVQVLEDLGYVVGVSSGNTRTYLVTEDFPRLLLAR
jgi:hypothetical protein